MSVPSRAGLTGVGPAGFKLTGDANSPRAGAGGEGSVRWPAKLTRRRSTGAVDRERLFERLDAESDCPMVWVAGPAGAGKSTLLSSYIARRKLSSLWYLVDAGDADAATVFDYLAQGLSAMTGLPNQTLPALTPEYRLDLSGFARQYFRLFFAVLPPSAVLVFDSIENAPGSALLDLLPIATAEVQAGQRLFASSRDKPPAAVAHLHVKGSMAVLDSDDLRLTADEALALANRGAAAPQEAVLQLHGVTDGWAAGFVVLLAHLGRTGRLADPGADALGGPILSYYLNELFVRADTATQLLLMRTAVLPSFTAIQAAALAPDADAPAVLHTLVHRHFFIERGDGQAPVYRYHALFRKFLLHQGRERLGVQERRSLLRQAAYVLQDGGEAEAALPLLIEAGAEPEAARLVCDLAPSLLAHGRNVTLATFIDALPPSAGIAEPWLHYWRGMASLWFDAKRARTALEAAYTGFEGRSDSVGRMLASAAVLDSYWVEWGDLRAVDRWGDLLYAQLCGPHPDLPEQVEVQVLTRISVLVFRGHRHSAIVEFGYQRALKLLLRLERPALRLAVVNFIGLLHFVRGEWYAGRQLVVATAPLLQAPGVMPLQRVVWQALRSRLLVWGGECEAAYNAAIDTERLAAEHHIGVLAAVTASAAVFAAVNADDPVRAEACLARMQQGLVSSRILDVAQADFHRGVVALTRGNARAGVEDLRAAVDRAAACGAEQFAAQFRICLALALVELDRMPAAAAELQQVVAYATASRVKVLEHSALVASAWLAWRSGVALTAVALLRVAFAMGREHGYRVVYPWVPVALLQDLCLLALKHGIEADHVRELIRLRAVPPPSVDADLWPWRIRLFTLGRFEVQIDGKPLRPAPKVPRRPLELLQALVALGGAGAQGATVGIVGQHLWPDLDGAATQNAFNIALHRLRRLLGDEHAVTLRDGRLLLDPLRVWIDVRSFDCVVDRLASDSGPEPGDRLIGVYGGHFLPGEESSWALAARERLRNRFLRAATNLCDSLERTGQVDAAVDLQRRVIEIEPLAEDFHRRLMCSLHALGRRGEALDVYQRCHDLLDRMLGIRPSAQTQQLFQTIGM
jgi:DNA-binding SARP family transcriptional activator